MAAGACIVHHIDRSFGGHCLAEDGVDGNKGVAFHHTDSQRTAGNGTAVLERNLQRVHARINFRKHQIAKASHPKILVAARIVEHRLVSVSDIGRIASGYIVPRGGKILVGGLKVFVVGHRHARGGGDVGLPAGVGATDRTQLESVDRLRLEAADGESGGSGLVRRVADTYQPAALAAARSPRQGYGIDILHSGQIGGHQAGDLVYSNIVDRSGRVLSVGVIVVPDEHQTPVARRRDREAHISRRPVQLSVKAYAIVVSIKIDPSFRHSVRAQAAGHRRAGAQRGVVGRNQGNVEHIVALLAHSLPVVRNGVESCRQGEVAIGYHRRRHTVDIGAVRARVGRDVKTFRAALGVVHQRADIPLVYNGAVAVEQNPGRVLGHIFKIALVWHRGAPILSIRKKRKQHQHRDEHPFLLSCNSVRNAFQ